MGKRRTLEKDKTPKLHKTRQQSAKKGRNKTPEVPPSPSSPAFLSPRNPPEQSTPKAHIVKAPAKLFQTPRREEFFLLSQADPNADVAWDCNSPDALRHIKLVKNGKSAESIADLVKILATEDDEDDDLPPKTPPLLGLWMDKETEQEDKKKNPRPHKKFKNTMRKKTSIKVPMLDTQLFEQLSAAILRQNSKDEASINEDGADSPTELFSDSSDDNGKCVDSTKVTDMDSPHSSTQNFTNIRANPDSEVEDWADGDDLFNDSSFLFQATQLPGLQSPCAGTRSKSLTVKKRSSSPLVVKSATNTIVTNTNCVQYPNKSTSKASDVGPSICTSSSTGSKPVTRATNKPMTFKMPSTNQYLNNRGNQIKQSVTCTNVVHTKPVSNIRTHTFKQVNQLGCSQSVIPPSQSVQKSAAVSFAGTSMQMKTLPTASKYSMPSSSVTSSSTSVVNTSSNVTQQKRAFPPTSGPTVKLSKEPIVGLKSNSNNQSQDWDTSLTDDLLSQLLETDDFFEDAIGPTQPVTNTFNTRYGTVKGSQDSKESLSQSQKSQSQISQVFGKPTVRASTTSRSQDTAASSYKPQVTPQQINPQCPTTATNSGCRETKISGNKAPIILRQKTQNPTMNVKPFQPSVKTNPQDNPKATKFSFKKQPPSCAAASHVVALACGGVEDMDQDSASLSDDDILTQPAVLALLDQMEAQPSQQCTADEIEKKKQEALKRRNLKTHNIESKIARRS